MNIFQMRIINMLRNVWKTFSMKNMGEYHDLYLQSDILITWLMYLKTSEKHVLSIIN